MAGEIEISRDISEINKKLKELNSTIKSSSKEVKGLQKSLELDPKSTKLQTQVAKELNIQLEAQKSKLDELKKLQDSYDKKKLDKQSLEYRKVTNEIAKTEAAVKSLENQTNKLNRTEALSKFASKFKNISNVISNAILGITGAITSVGVTYAKEADEIQVALDKFGGTAEEWQLSTNAWDKVTGSADAYEQVLTAVNANLGKIQKDSGEVGEILSQLGLNFDDLKGKTSTEALDIYLNALKNIGDEATRQSLAIALFGDSVGTYLNQMSDTSSAALNQYNEEMKEAGLLTTEQVQAGAELQDTFDYLTQSLKKMVANLGSSFKPMIESIVQLIEGIVPIISSIVQGLAALGPIGLTIMVSMAGILKIIPGVVAAFSALKLLSGDWASALAALTIIGTFIGGYAIGSILGSSNSPLYSNYSNEASDSVNYDQLNSEREGIESKTSNLLTTTNNSSNIVTTNNYYDNSSMTNNISKDVDYETMVDYITEKKRVLIGG